MGEKPLSGVSVIEVGHIVAAPYATLVLSDLGADVVKVESPDGGDRTRTGGRTFKSMFHSFNRDKRSVTVDLKSVEEREKLYGLVEETDVFVENFAPGTAEKLGIGYETLREHNPALVYASIKGYADGPYSDRLSNDPVAEAMSGLMNMTGERDGPPVRVGASPIDMMAASNAVIGVLAALLQREFTGEGQHVVAPLFEAAVGLTSYWQVFRQIFGEEPRRSGAALYTQKVPYDTYETAGGDLVFIGCPTDRSWESLKDVLDVEVDPQLESDRTTHAAEINEAVEAATRRWDADELVDALSDRGVQAAPINEMADVLEDPHLNEIGLFTEIDVRDADERLSTPDVTVPRFPIWTDAYDFDVGVRGPPSVGEDNEAVFGGAEVEDVSHD